MDHQQQPAKFTLHTTALNIIVDQEALILEQFFTSIALCSQEQLTSLNVGTVLLKWIEL